MQKIVEELRTEIAAALEVAPEQVDPDIDLTDQGLDSVRLMGLMGRIQDAGHSVDYADLADDPRLAAWDRLLDT